MDHQWNPMGGFQPQPTHHQHHPHHAQQANQATAQYLSVADQEIALARAQVGTRKMPPAITNEDIAVDV